MRPAGGPAGAMALEDRVVLTGMLSRIDPRPKDDFASRTEPKATFRKIWHDQKERADRAYKKGVTIGTTDKEFFEWVYKGV